MKIGKGFFIVVGGLFVFFSITGTIYMNRLSKERFDNFYKHEIEGIITYVRSGGQGHTIVVNNKERFIFHTQTINDFDRSFYVIASEGDSVYKAPESRDLFLFSNGQTYLYNCQAHRGGEK